MSLSSPVHLASFDDALYLAGLVLGDLDTAAALIDGGETRLAVPVRGTAGPEILLALDAILLPEHEGRLVYATRRPGGPEMVCEDELAAWRELVARHDGSPLVLCDWFVFVGDDVVLSVAELAGPPAPWARQ